MPLSKHQILSGWGNAPAQDCVSYRPEKKRELQLILKEHQGSLLARGMGRSYGDASLSANGVIRTERMDHFIEFDPSRGVVRAQAGVTLAELMDLAIPRGWFPANIPGTRFVSLGGAFACNVHGKNHYREGDFAEHVQSIRLTLASGETIACSPTDKSDIFWATAGGMGMTGIIEEITLQLKPISSASLKTNTYCVKSIEDMVGAFERYRDSADYMVGWIDHMASGESLGRGVFEAANHITTGDGGMVLSEFTPAPTKLKVPVFLPGFVLNRYSMALYNRWRFKKYTVDPRSEIVNFNGFFHPLDSIGMWNKLYGKRGFFQYQCLIPETPDIASKLRHFLETVHQCKGFSFLAVIKYHREGKGLLTFPLRGYSIALDFPNTARVRSMLPKLDQWVADHGGRIYLAKDAMLTPELFHKMYGKSATEWCEQIHDIDPDNRFTSMMSERLQWKNKA
jgi:FAD/FMN-containing dehydrogenase